jgi:hypothetical protein
MNPIASIKCILPLNITESIRKENHVPHTIDPRNPWFTTSITDIKMTLSYILGKIILKFPASI